MPPTRSLVPAFVLSLLAGAIAGCATPAAQIQNAPPAEPAEPAEPAVPGETALPPPADESPANWFLRGRDTARSARADAAPAARNLILFIGDGMGMTTVAAARILGGQRGGSAGEEHRLAFERFPHTALSKTYNTNLQTPDSAGTMTAMASGVKTRAGVIGVHQAAPRGDCAAAQAAEVPTLLELAEDAGLATGIVTSTRITHATPAAAFGHSADRNWESDADLPESARETGCIDLAAQLTAFDHGDGLDVVLGGGRQMLLPQGTADPEYPEIEGRRQDGRNLIEEWRQRHPGGSWIWNASQFAELDFATAGPVLGLFQPGHLQYEHDRPGDAAGEPSLAELTTAALRRLQRETQGYVLVVEGGRIDHAHHAGNAFRALTDTLAFDAAVAAAVAMTDVEDTLIVVTADHSHTLSFAGYSQRGNPILGRVSNRYGTEDLPRLALDATGRAYTTLNYANGPGYAGASDEQPEGPKRYPHFGVGFQPASRGRADLSQTDTMAPDHLQDAAMPLSSETHGGEDVVVYARGPGADAVRGVIEQNVVFHLLVQAQPALAERSARQAALMTLPGFRAPGGNRFVSGAIGSDDLDALRAAGIRHVVDLRPASEHPDFDEAAALGGTGISHYAIAVANADDLDRGSVEALDRALAAIGDQPALMHCASGNRVGALMALRAGWLYGRSPAEALAEGRRHGLGSLQGEVEKRLLR